MRDSVVRKKHKHAKSSSDSSPFSISDDDSPRQRLYRDNKNAEERHVHRKHQKHNHKHHKHRNEESSSGDEIKTKDKIWERDGRPRDGDRLPVVKEEPLSDDERERKCKRRNTEHSREESNKKKFKEDPKKKNENEDSKGSSGRHKKFVKEEPHTDVEPEWGKKEVKKEKKEPIKNNAKPDFGLSGKLTEDANTFNGVVIKYSEPPEARKPKRRWRLYPFKGEVSLPVLHIHRQSAYLLGRDRKVADIPIDHPSCSKQHAALQYRLVPFTRSDGSSGRQIKLYVIDLESANGTFLNNKKVEPKKYYELKERDVVKFGFSSREYVILHEHSKDSENDDDVANDD